MAKASTVRPFSFVLLPAKHTLHPCETGTRDNLFDFPFSLVCPCLIVFARSILPLVFFCNFCDDLTALSANGHGFSDDTPPYSRTHSLTYPLTLTHSRTHALVLSLTHSRPHSTICSQRRRTSAYTYRSILPSRTLAHSPRPLEALQPEAYSTFHSPVCLLTARLLHRVRPALHIKSVVRIYRDGHCGERFPLLSCLLTHPYRLKHCSHRLIQASSTAPSACSPLDCCTILGPLCL